MSKPSKKISVIIPKREEDEAITAAAMSDPDELQLTQSQLEQMVQMRSWRGQPKSVNKKQLLSIRYSPEVLA